MFVRDLGQIIGFLLTLWFFLTPICYPESIAAAAAAAAADRRIRFTCWCAAIAPSSWKNHAPDFGPLWKLWLLAIAVFLLGHAWFYKLRKSFPDLL